MGDGPRPGKARGIGPTGASNEPGPKFTPEFSSEMHRRMLKLTRLYSHDPATGRMHRKPADPVFGSRWGCPAPLGGYAFW